VTIKLPISIHEKPWGLMTLPEPFSHLSGPAIGEIWFDPPPGEALLVKYLFTSERLSIQVHPDDEQARRHGQLSGKEECWYILEAQPGAVIGIGTKRTLDAAELQAACLSGEIEGLLEWHPVSAGMFFHVPPGTIHAIGAGVSLVEIQQNSDITYRLYDYGRPRPLHLREAMDVARAQPMPAALRQVVDPLRTVSLLKSAVLDVSHYSAGDSQSVDLRASTLVIPISGIVRLDNVEVGIGECALIEAACLVEMSQGSRFLAASSGLGRAGSLSGGSA
jgi:mannose-6-phosphate isomerase